jgi:hypothetical protein
MRTRRPTFAVGVWSASLESSGIFRQEPSAFIVLLQEPLTIGPSKCLNETQWSLLWHSYRTRRRSQGASARVNRPAHVVYRCLRIRTPMNTWGGDRMKYCGRAGAFGGEASGGSQFGSAFFAIPGIGPVLVAGRPLVGVDRGSPVRRRGIWRFERNRWAALWPGYSEV